MRTDHRWTPLHMSILAMLFVTTYSEGSDCNPEIQVRRHTKYEADRGEDLRIECPVAFCNASPPEVQWLKEKESGFRAVVDSEGHIKVEWKSVKEFEGKSFLIFRNIYKNDEGLYQCQIPGGISHYINVSVNEDTASVESNNATQMNDTSKVIRSFVLADNHSGSKVPEIVWLYVYCAAGIVSFVIIVIIISVISMRGCKEKSKEKTQTENQYEAIEMIKQHANLHPSPRGSPCVVPPRRSARRQTPSRQLNELRSSRDNEQLSEQMKEDRHSKSAAPEVRDGSVVYAALNHDLPQRPAARPLRPVTSETSEYAAIRVS
ncbi:uncharacterized protein FYW49_020268 [Xenentodon cancila]